MKEEMISQFAPRITHHASCSRKPITSSFLKIFKGENFIFPHQPNEDINLPHAIASPEPPKNQIMHTPAIQKIIKGLHHKLPICYESPPLLALGNTQIVQEPFSIMMSVRIFIEVSFI